ncbi:MAG: GIY-YIG nuclease family protein [Dolichospermum sp.]
MNIVQVFDSSEIRFVSHPENKFEFGVVAKDLAVILETNEGKGLAKYVDDEWKGVIGIQTRGGIQSMSVIWEPGIYQLLAKSRKPQAKAMFKWLMTQKASGSIFSIGNGKWGVNDNSGFIYLAQASQTQWCKIGMSKQPYKRMQSLQTGSPLEIILIHRIYTLDAIALEKSLHEYFDAYRVRGEWFDLPTECIQEFPIVANQLDAVMEQVCLPQ